MHDLKCDRLQGCRSKAENRIYRRLLALVAFWYGMVQSLVAMYHTIKYDKT